MSIKLYVLISSLFAIPPLAVSQEISEHQWKNRVLLIFGENPDSHDFRKQISSLTTESKALEERKLMIYQILPNKYNAGIMNTGWIQSSELYGQFMEAKSSFQIILVGLDGTIKLRKSKPVTPTFLFAQIDAMPMRRRELRRKE